MLGKVLGKEAGSSAQLLSVAGVSLARFAGSGLALLFTAIASSVLGPEDAGRFFLTLVCASTIATLAHWGGLHLIFLIIAPLARGWRRIAASALLSRFLLSALVRAAAIVGLLAVIFVLLSEGQRSDLGLIPVFLILLLPALIVQQQWAMTSRALGQPVLGTVLEFWVLPGFTLVAYFVVTSFWPGPPIELLPILYFLAACVSAGALAVWGLKQVRFVRPTRGVLLSRTRKRARNFAIIDICQVLSVWGGLLMMPLILGTSDVGLFNLVVRFSGLILLVNVSILTVLTPRLAIAHDDRDVSAYRSAYRSSWALMAVAGAVFVIGVAVLGEFVLEQVGPGFSSAYLPLLVLSSCYAAGLALGPAAASLAVRGYERIQRSVTIASTIAGLVLSALAMFQFGILGAAAVAGLMDVARKLVFVYFDRKLDRVGKGAGSE